MPLKLRIVHSLIMALLLCSLVTAWVTYINLGLHSGFIKNWITAFLLAYPAAAFIAFAIGPYTLQLAKRITGEGDQQR